MEDNLLKIASVNKLERTEDKMPDVAMIYLIKYRLRFGTNIDERYYEMARNNPWKLIGAIELSLKFNKDFIPAVLNDTIIPFLNGEGV